MGSFEREGHPEDVTSRKGRVSRNLQGLFEVQLFFVTSRKGRVSRNKTIEDVVYFLSKSRPVRGV